jgi:hypothetical protein
VPAADDRDREPTQLHDLARGKHGPVQHRRFRQTAVATKCRRQMRHPVNAAPDSYPISGPHNRMRVAANDSNSLRAARTARPWALTIRSSRPRIPTSETDSPECFRLGASIAHTAHFAFPLRSIRPPSARAFARG